MTSGHYGTKGWKVEMSAGGDRRERKQTVNERMNAVEKQSEKIDTQKDNKELVDS